MARNDILIQETKKELRYEETKRLTCKNCVFCEPEGLDHRLDRSFHSVCVFSRITRFRVNVEHGRCRMLKEEEEEL